MYTIKPETLTAIADSIRAKTGKTEPINPLIMPFEISSIEGGGSVFSIKGIVERYKVNAGASVSAGDFVEFVNRFNRGTFETNAASYVSACKIDNKSVFLAWSDASVGWAGVVTIGETCTISKAAFSSVMVEWIDATMIAEGKVLIVYRVPSNSSRGEAIVATIEDGQIRFGASKAFDTSAYPSYIAVTTLKENKAIVVYRDYIASDNGRCVVLNINGEIITPGIATTFNGAKTYGKDVIALAEDRALIAFQDVSQGSAVAVSIVDDNITVGAKVTFHSADTPRMCMARLDGDRALMAYASGGNGYVKVLSVSGTTITLGASLSFTNQYAYDLSIAMLTANKAIVTYRNQGNSNYGEAAIFTVDNTKASHLGSSVFETNATTYTSVVAFSETSAFVAFNNNTGAFSGLTIDGASVASDGMGVGTYVQPATSNVHFAGLALTAGVEGDYVDVCLDGDGEVKVNGGSGGTAKLQTKTVEITQNGIKDIIADSGYDGLERVTIFTEVPSITPTYYEGEVAIVTDNQ